MRRLGGGVGSWRLKLGGVILRDLSWRLVEFFSSSMAVISWCTGLAICSERMYDTRGTDMAGDLIICKSHLRYLVECRKE